MHTDLCNARVECSILNEFDREGHLVAENNDGNRRDFLYIATGAVGAVTTGVAVWPLVNQMNPSADVRALASIEVDVSEVEPGAQLTVLWRGKPVFIRRRTGEEIASARSASLEEMRDRESANQNKPEADASDENRAIDEAGEWLVMIGVCTHLGCVPLNNAGDFGGWFCPCHGSHYDMSGRIRRGPAPTNLEVPIAAFIEENILKLG